MSTLNPNVLMKKTFEELSDPRSQRYKKFGLSYGAVVRILQAQGNRCAGCRVPLEFCSLNPNVKKPNVDHCHRLEGVRGILCRECNLILGLAKDNADVLLRLAGYIISGNKKPLKESWRIPEAYEEENLF